MKALELTVYPKMGSVYYDDEANCTWSETMVYGLSVEKRLTDAELAAEYHAASHEFDMDWFQTGIDDPKLERITEAMYRFATLPHYDEPTTTTGVPQ